MNTDFRIATAIFTHPKFIKLTRRLGDGGGLSYMRLLGFASGYRADGRMTGMDNEDIALAAGYQGDSSVFVDTLISLRLLDRDGELIVIHDWADHNPWAAEAPARREQARAAAEARWGKRNGAHVDSSSDVSPKSVDKLNVDAPAMRYDANSNALSTDEQCSEHSRVMPLSFPFLSSPYQTTHTPSYSPTPRISAGGDDAVHDPPGVAVCVDFLKDILPDEAEGVRLVETFGADEVRWQAEAVRWRLEQANRPKIRDPVSYLLNCLRRKRQLPGLVQTRRDWAEAEERVRLEEAGRLEHEPHRLAEEARIALRVEASKAQGAAFRAMSGDERAAIDAEVVRRYSAMSKFAAAYVKGHGRAPFREDAQIRGEIMAERLARED